MSEDRTPSGGHTDMHSQTSLVLQIATFCFRCHVWQVGQRRHPWLRIALPDTRCPRVELRALGCVFASKRILRCRLLGRLSYKAFDEAKPPAPSQPEERNHVD